MRTVISRASTALLGAVLLSLAPDARANHPVFVEGNGCADGGPTATSVPPGTCGDYDGDGLIGTAEDTDNATDRVFGTLRAALGNTDLGAAINATHANQNGRVVIVTSGRFREQVVITAANGNVSLEAAPGVDADIDAVVQGVANNAAAQGTPGIVVDAPRERRVTIRNIMSRNWTEGIQVVGDSHVAIDGCRLENNRDFGIHVMDDATVVITDSDVNATGFRQAGGVDNAPNPGTGIAFEDESSGLIDQTTVTGSFATGIANRTEDDDDVRLRNVAVFDNRPNTRGF